MAPVVQALRERGGIIVGVCVTAQHREMLDQVLRVFDIEPDFDLDLMRENQGLPELTSRVLMGVQSVIREFLPDRILVHGDTTTSFAASLAAFYEGISVGHVEAGLRTGNMRSPWPEEANRRLTAVLSELNFAPTELARDNLLREGVSPKSVFVTGNTVVDALLRVKSRLEEDASLAHEAGKELPVTEDGRRIILVTVHRRESFGRGLKNIFQALAELACSEPIEIIYPVHRNPQVIEAANACLGGIRNVHLIDPLDYLPFVTMMVRADIVVTDSGGIQEEAPSLGNLSWL